jgi:hypothetical protein
MHVVQWSSEAESNYFERQEQWSQDDYVNANGNGKTESFSIFTWKLKDSCPKNLIFIHIHHRELTFLSQDTAL